MAFFPLLGGNPPPAAPARTPGGFLGIDEDELRQARLAAWMSAMGGSLLGGRNWQEGLSRGFISEAEAVRGTETDAYSRARMKSEAAKEAEEQAARERRRRALEQFERMPTPPNAIVSSEDWMMLPGEERLDVYKDYLKQGAKPVTPNVETIWRGDMAEQGYYDRSGNWVKLGGGPRWQPLQPGADAGAWETVDVPGIGKAQRNKRTGKLESVPGQGGGLTPTMSANNAEIAAARRYLTESSFTMDEILRRTQEATALGRENPDYDPYLQRTFNLAMQRKVGDDPDFESFQGRYRGGGTAAPIPLLGGPYTAVPGSTRGGDNTAVPMPGAEGAAELPRTDAGDINASQLTVGGVYDDGAGGRWKWTGNDFIAVPQR